MTQERGLSGIEACTPCYPDWETCLSQPPELPEDFRKHLDGNPLMREVTVNGNGGEPSLRYLLHAVYFPARDTVLHEIEYAPPGSVNEPFVRERFDASVAEYMWFMYCCWKMFKDPDIRDGIRSGEVDDICAEYSHVPEPVLRAYCEYVCARMSRNGNGHHRNLPKSQLSRIGNPLRFFPIMLELYLAMYLRRYYEGNFRFSDRIDDLHTVDIVAEIGDQLRALEVKLGSWQTFDMRRDRNGSRHLPAAVTVLSLGGREPDYHRHEEDWLTDPTAMSGIVSATMLDLKGLPVPRRFDVEHLLEEAGFTPRHLYGEGEFVAGSVNVMS